MVKENNCLPVTVVELDGPLHPQLVRLTGAPPHPLTPASPRLPLVHVNHKLVLTITVLTAATDSQCSNRETLYCTVQYSGI